MTQMKSYQWPGNIRELRNALERAAYRKAEHKSTVHYQDLGLKKPNKPLTAVQPSKLSIPAKHAIDEIGSCNSLINKRNGRAPNSSPQLAARLIP